MYTDVLFINRSLNTNVSRIGMFMARDTGSGLPDEEPEQVLWHLIENCAHDWRHKVRINHDPWLQVLDHDGNIPAAEPVSGLLGENGAGVARQLGRQLDRRLGRRLGLKVRAVAGQDKLDVSSTSARRLAQVAVIRNGRATAIRKLPTPGLSVQMDISNRLIFCADMRLAPGAMITADDVNVSLRAFDLANIRSMTVYMLGGRRGPKSEAIKFMPADICRW